MDRKDLEYKKSMYIRYGDDFVDLFEVAIYEARVIKDKLKTALLDLTGLELFNKKKLYNKSTKGKTTKSESHSKGHIKYANTKTKQQANQ